MSILVYAEVSNGKLKKPALEAASYGAQVGNDFNLDIHALVIGKITNEEAQTLSNHGIANIHVLNSEDVAVFNDSIYTSAIADLANKINASFVILPQTYNSRAIAPRLAIKLDCALLSGVTSLPQKSGNGISVARTAYSGKAIQTLFVSETKAVITVKANSIGIINNQVTATTIQQNYQASSKDKRLRIKETIRNSEKISLTEADIVVSAGRGLKGPENWGMIEELASILGAATACSKPVADVHWRPHNEHVGQTGIQIAPNVYIAIGISGAIQHLAGVNSSKTIIVINKDPEAPFFKAADYGIVGDAFQVIPALNTALKQRIS